MKKPITEEMARNMDTCPCCGESKQVGCVVCWHCFKKEGGLKYSNLSTDEWLAKNCKPIEQITACACGSKDFTCYEEYTHSGEVDEDGGIIFKNDGSEIKKIVCAECGKKYDSGAFKNVQFD